MTITPGDLANAVLEVLQEAATDAGRDIYLPGDWALKPKDAFPAIRVMPVRDRKTSQGRGGLIFTVVTTVRLVLQTQAPAIAGDAGGATAVERLWNLQRQVEVAVINNPALSTAVGIQQYPEINSQFAVDAMGALQLSEMVMDIDFEYVQAWEDFHPTPFAPLTEITGSATLAIDTQPTGFDVDLPSS